MMEGKDMYENPTIISAYVRYTTGVAVALGADPETAEREMTDIVNFEREIARVGLSSSVLCFHV